jgi:N-acetylmuramoyl-L-alanine amidase
MFASLVLCLLLNGCGPSSLHESARPESPQAASRSRVPTRRFARPNIQDDLIPYGQDRKREMANYSERHYGVPRWRLQRHRVVVLHFTGGNSYSSAWNTFASNAPNHGELPGVCAHFIVGQGGTIYKLVPLRIRCRHAIGLNYTSIGIEMVQPTGVSPHWADRQILHRRRQIRAALHLVRWLRSRFDIRMRNVIGHAMANDSPFFKDLEGWRNTHTDWLRRDVRVFRRRLRRVS